MQCNKNCSICIHGYENSKCLTLKNNYFKMANEYQLIYRFYFNEYPNDKELIKETIKKYYNRTIIERKFRSKGEILMYINFLYEYITSPNLLILQEAQLNKYGCPRALRADFLITNLENQPIAVVEVQGPQHYTDKKVIERDEYKSEWCWNNNIAYLYGDWNGGINLNFMRFANEYTYDWKAMETFEWCLRQLNDLTFPDPNIIHNLY